MDELIQGLKVSLASTFAFYLKAHGFHWNVEGPNFPSYHEFFETIYSDAFGAVDGIAEHIRTLGSFAPAALSRYMDLSIVKDAQTIPEAKAMIQALISDNAAIIDQLTKVQALAEQNKKMGLANYLQDRIDLHEKHGWMLRATAV